VTTKCAQILQFSRVRVRVSVRVTVSVRVSVTVRVSLV